MKIISFVMMLVLAMCLMTGCRMNDDGMDTTTTTTTKATTTTTATTTTATTAAPTTGTTEPSGTVGDGDARMPHFGFNGR